MPTPLDNTEKSGKMSIFLSLPKLKNMSFFTLVLFPNRATTEKENLIYKLSLQVEQVFERASSPESERLIIVAKHNAGQSGNEICCLH